MSDWLTIINPSAGRRGSALTRVQEAFRAHGLDGEFHVTESGDHVRQVTTDGLRSGASHFVAVGGDGTASLVADTLLGAAPSTRPVLGILPAGSGCDFVRTFGIPQRLEDAAAHLVGDQTYTVDVGVVAGAWGTRRFLNAADLGVLGATVQRSEGVLRHLGRLRYKAAFWATLPGFRPAEVKVEMERRSFEGIATAVVLANGQFFGGGMNVAPKAMLVDGELDVQVFTGPKRQALTLLPKVTRGLHLGHKAVRRFRSGRLTVETDRPWPLEIDGDYLGTTPVSVTVEPGALDIKI